MPALTQREPEVLQRLNASRKEVHDFCERWQVTDFSLFGSVLKEHFAADSDIDVLVTFAPEASVTLFQLVEMQHELEALFGRPVDLLTRGGVESSRNPLRRQSILSSVKTLYAA